jgi:hypothetical protein
VKYAVTFEVYFLYLPGKGLCFWEDRVEVMSLHTNFCSFLTFVLLLRMSLGGCLVLTSCLLSFLFGLSLCFSVIVNKFLFIAFDQEMTAGVNFLVY